MQRRGFVHLCIDESAAKWQNEMGGACCARDGPPKEESHVGKVPFPRMLMCTRNQPLALCKRAAHIQFYGLASPRILRDVLKPYVDRQLPCTLDMCCRCLAQAGGAVDHRPHDPVQLQPTFEGRHTTCQSQPRHHKCRGHRLSMGCQRDLLKCLGSGRETHCHQDTRIWSVQPLPRLGRQWRWWI